MNLDPSQERAVDLVCSARFGVVTGGPGTGKTTSLRAALDRLDAAGVTYALAAPTGKAARRMSEATGRAAGTVHRLLEYWPGRGFMRNERAPLDVDLVVVDEASMLDVELARALLDAVREQTRCILVGDANQLPSVGPGRVFGDLIDSRCVPVARLTTLHRAAQERWVASQAPVILAGKVPDLREREDFVFVEREDRAEAFESVVDFAVQVEGAQVLVPQNVGPAGADLLNAAIREQVNPWRGGDQVFEIGGRSRCWRGDRVIQTRNDYAREVMNGEVGEVEGAAGDELAVRFDRTETDEGRLVLYDREAARQLRLAYALTVHKSQGSEWPWVIVLCHSTHSRMLERTLLYTAITRASHGVVLIGDRKGIERAVRQENAGKRNTGLVERLMEAAE